MDREIPKEQLQKERRRKWIKIGAVALLCVAIVAVIISLLQERVSLQDLNLSTVEQGTIEVSVSASGKVVPAFEEVVNTPISSRIVEVYTRAGDTVSAGTPLLRLDLQSIQTDYEKMLDELQLRRYRLEQQRIKNSSALSNAEMQLKVSQMQIDKLAVEVRNERYLDSIGAGTTDKVREVQLRYDVARLEQEQAVQKFANDQKVAAADVRMQELELNIFQKSLAETKRILEDAKISAPRSGTVTYINDQIGVQVAQGSQVAVIADLSQFKIEGEIADSYADRLSIGNKVVVKIGLSELGGWVSNVSPGSKNGVIQFAVQLQEPAHPQLRSGLKCDVYVLHAIKEEVLRIDRGSFYMGPGKYKLYLYRGDELIEREVQLGESNYEYIEVVAGLQSGDQVVVSDMSSYRDRKSIKVSK